MLIFGILIGVGLGYFFHEPIGRGLGKALAKVKSWREKNSSQQQHGPY
jgi:hypothetical protein